VIAGRPGQRREDDRDRSPIAPEKTSAVPEVEREVIDGHDAGLPTKDEAAE
jgi:hypothetical protein